ncbi:MAG: ABC transporter ATP-binding protein [Chloroflexota bacterium]|nr:ABC transporter ATP-binding protein [Chloroflexota bacterium]
MTGRVTTADEVAGAPPHTVVPSLAIETRGLRKEYGEKVAVHDVTIAVPEGEVFGFLGPNGAGKSTTVKMLLGLAFPTGGTARLLGHPLGAVEAKRRIGFLPEQFRFHEWLRGEEFLDLHGQLYGLARAARRRRIPEVLELVGLAGRGRDRLRTYSKGMLQRVGLAQALLHDPALVFLDEPTSALDPIGRREVRDIIRALKACGMTVFLNSHLLSEVETVCDRGAIIDRGRVVRQGTLDDLLREALDVDLTLGALDDTALRRIAAYGAIEGVARDGRRDGGEVRVRMDDFADVPRLVDALVRAGVAVYGVTPHRRSLEDVFLGSVEGGTE